MKFKRLTEHVYAGYVKVPFPIMMWIVDGEDGITLVDGGIPSMGKAISAVVEKNFPGKQVVRLLLTHGHGDHVGSMYGWQERYNLPIHTDEQEIPFLIGERTYESLRDGNKAGGGSKPFARETLRPLDMGSVYAGLKPYATPGHSPGHTAFYHEADDILLAGDMLTSFFGTLRRPIPFFTADMEQALESTTLLETLRPRWLSCAHGTVVEEPMRQYAEFRKKYSLTPAVL